MKISTSAKIISLGIFVAIFSGCVVVEDGEIGVSKRFGKISDTPLEPGPYVVVPVVREIETWDVKTQRRSLALNIPSAEGLIVGMQVSVLFRPKNVVQLRKKVGRGFIETVLDSTLIDTFRSVIGKRRVEDIIRNQETLTAEVGTDLQETLGARGIVIEELMITGLDLPQNFKVAIERKLEQEQKALQKKFELESAKRDAEIEVATARGLAEAQDIISSTLTPEYLQHLWIRTLKENPNVIYVATEANMPMFRTAPMPNKKPVVANKKE